MKKYDMTYDIKEAINMLTLWVEPYRGKSLPANMAKARIALDLSITALQRSIAEPCEWCNRLNDYLGDNGGMVDVKTFNFCPNCGRKL